MGWPKSRNTRSFFFGDSLTWKNLFLFHSADIVHLDSYFYSGLYNILIK